MFGFDRWMLQPLTETADLGGGGGGAVDLDGVISGSLEGVDRGDPAAGAVDLPADPALETKEPTAEEKEEQELAALEQEIRTKNPTMQGTLAVHRHQAVLTRNRNQWAAEKTELEKKYKQLEWANDPDIKRALGALALAETDQKAFVEMLMQDERFANLIAFKEAQKEAAAGTGQASGQNERPGPNKLSEDGTYKFYDEEGLQQLMAYERKMAVEEAKTALMKEFGPVKQEYEARNAWNQSLETQRGVLENARTNWKGFKENEPAIKAALMADQKLSLDDAYRQVVIEKFSSETKVNREKLRAEILAEMSGKPRAASTLKPGGGVEREVDTNKTVDLEDVIRRTLPSER